jgi:hypothetical protein
MTPDEVAKADEAIRKAKEKAEADRKARIEREAAHLTDVFKRHRAVFLVSREAHEIIAHLGVPGLCIGSATAAELRAMEDAIAAGSIHVLYCAHGAEGMLDRVAPLFRERLYRVDLTAGARRLFATAKGADPGPLRTRAKNAGADSYFWGTEPKFVGADFPNRMVTDALVDGWRTTAYRTVLRGTARYPEAGSTGYYWMALQNMVRNEGGSATGRFTAHDMIVEARMPSEKAAVDFEARTESVVWIEKRFKWNAEAKAWDSVDVECQAPLPAWTS